jgi:hypothetical protein
MVLRSASLIVLAGIAATAVVQGLACSNSNTDAPTDAGATDHAAPQNDAGGLLTCNGPAPVITVRDSNGNQVAPDWSCYSGASLAPFDVDGGDGGDAAGDDGGDAAADAADAANDAASEAGGDAGTDAAPPGDAGPMLKLSVIEFVTHQPVGGAHIELHFGSDTGNTPDFIGDTDDGGILSFPFPTNDAGVLSYYATGPTLFDVQFFSQPITKNVQGTTLGYSITKSNTQILIAAVLGSEPEDTSKAILVAAARDCQQRELRGAQFVLMDDDAQQPVAGSSTPGGVRLNYFNDQGLPDPRCDFTSNGNQAVWAVLNAPVNMPGHTHNYSLHLSGRQSESDTAPHEIFAGPIELWANAGNVARPFKVTPPQ